MSRAEIIEALEACRGDAKAAAQMIMASDQIQPEKVNFRNVGQLSQELFKQEPDTLFVFDLDDTTFSARGENDFAMPRDVRGIKKFPWRNSYFTEDMAEFLRDVPEKNVLFLTAGGYDPQMIQHMVDSVSTKEGVPKNFVHQSRVRFRDKLQTISDLIEELGGTVKRVVFFDDQPRVFYESGQDLRDIDWPDNLGEVKLYRVHLDRQHPK